jgi:hypothetical protein
MCCAKKVVRGATGLIKAATGIGTVSLEVMQKRRDVCRECPEATRNPDPKFAVNKGLTKRSRCRMCKCFIAAKTKVASERCPLNKWEAHQI